MVTRQLQVERRTGKVRRPKTDVLPLCHVGTICALGTAVVWNGLTCRGNGVLVQQQAGCDGAAAEEVDVRDERSEQGWTDVSSRGRVQTARRLRASAAPVPL